MTGWSSNRRASLDDTETQTAALSETSSLPLQNGIMVLTIFSSTMIQLKGVLGSMNMVQC